jgi:hypothetical protein
VVERDADARRVAADALRRAHDHGWVIVAEHAHRLLKWARSPGLGRWS